MKKVFLTLAAAAVLMAGSAAPAQAALITPDSGVLNDTRWEGNETGQAGIDAIIGLIMAPDGSVELYKYNVGGVEEGLLTGSYTPAMTVDGGTISYIGGAFVGPVAYLLVKDGNNEPAWYLFNLTDIFGWNGQDTLELSGFWPGQGAISHVTLYGTEGEGEDGGGGGSGGTIPEPATLVLFGAALAVAGARLRRRN